MTPRAIVTDVEGATSSISFVHDVLFPYSRARLADFVASHTQDATPVLEAVRRQVGDRTLDTEACVAQLLQWHDADGKVGPLKTLQGMIWAEGYEAGKLTGHVYPDAVAELRRWHGRGIRLYVYSSGSTAAQKLLFRHTDHGDLTGLFSGHFDTAIGAKREAASYRAIAASLNLPGEEILFLSDMEDELAAARAAGFSVTLIAREEGSPASSFPVVRDFHGVLPEDVRS